MLSAPTLANGFYPTDAGELTGDERMLACLRHLAAGSALQLEGLRPLLVESTGREAWDQLYHRQSVYLHLANLFEALHDPVEKAQSLHLPSWVMDGVESLRSRWNERQLEVMVDLPASLPVRWSLPTVTFRRLLLLLLMQAAGEYADGTLHLCLRQPKQGTGAGPGLEIELAAYGAARRPVEESPFAALEEPLWRHLLQALEGEENREGERRLLQLRRPQAQPGMVSARLPLPLQGLRLLLVDDMEANRRMLAEQLQAAGAVCTLAAGAREALAWLRGAPPVDLIVSDYAMPGMDGLALATALQAEVSLRHLPVVLLTARRDAALHAQCTAAGVAAYAVKPLERDRLYSLIAASWKYRRRGVEPALLTPERLSLPEGESRQWLAGHRLLLVDTNPVSRAWLSDVLKGVGAVLDCRTPEEVIHPAFPLDQYPLILLNRMQQPVDGDQLIRQLRRREMTAPLPPLLLLIGQEGQAAQALFAGADDYLALPFDEAMLGQLLVKWLPSAAPRPNPPTTALNIPNPQQPPRREQLRQRMGHRWRKGLEAYLHGMEQGLWQLQQLASRQHRQEMAALARRLGRYSAELELWPLAEALQRLEQQAGRGDSVEQLLSGLSELSRQWEATRPELQACRETEEVGHA